MSAQVIRIVDRGRHSRQADAVHPRDPADTDAIIIAFPRPRPSSREMHAILISLYGEPYLAALDLGVDYLRL